MRRIPKGLKTELICEWVPHEATQNADDETLSNLKAGDIIIIVGEVLNTSSSLDKKCENKHSSVTYNVLETRKLYKKQGSDANDKRRNDKEDN